MSRDRSREKEKLPNTSKVSRQNSANVPIVEETEIKNYFVNLPDFKTIDLKFDDEKFGEALSKDTKQDQKEILKNLDSNISLGIINKFYNQLYFILKFYNMFWQLVFIHDYEERLQLNRK